MLRLSLVSALMAAQLGCAAMSHRIASDLGPTVAGGMVEGGADALGSAAVQRDLASLLSDPQLQAALVDLTHALVGGVIDPLTEPQRAARLNRFSADFLAALGAASARVLQHDLSPALAVAAGAAVDAVLTSALREDHQQEVSVLVERLLHATSAGMATGLREDLYPALGATFGAPGFAASLGDIGFAFSQGVVRGSDAAMQEIAERKRVNQEPDSLLTWMSKTTVAGVSTSIFVAISMGIALVAGGILLVRASRERQRIELAASRRETALIALVAELSARVGVDVKGRLAELEAEDLGVG